jgi:hypothetical protein
LASQAAAAAGVPAEAGITALSERRPREMRRVGIEFSSEGGAE